MYGGGMYGNRGMGMGPNGQMGPDGMPPMSGMQVRAAQSASLEERLLSVVISIHHLVMLEGRVFRCVAARADDVWEADGGAGWHDGRDAFLLCGRHAAVRAGGLGAPRAQRHLEGRDPRGPHPGSPTPYPRLTRMRMCMNSVRARECTRSYARASACMCMLTFFEDAS